MTPVCHHRIDRLNTGDRRALAIVVARRDRDLLGKLLL
jgi:hypothetical protein